MAAATILQIVPRLDTGGAELATLEMTQAITLAGARAFVVTAGGRYCDAVRRSGGEVVVLPAASKNPLWLAANVNAIERLGMIWARNAGEAGGLPPPGERTVRPVRSITIDCAPETAATRLLYDTGPPRDDGGSGGWSAGSLAPSLVVLGSDAHAILVGIQPLGPRQCALHAAVAGPGDERARVSYWLEEFRRSVEAEPAT